MDRKTLRFYKSIFINHHGAVARLARELGLNRCSISLYLSGRFNSPRLEREIPRFLEENNMMPRRVAAKAPPAEMDPLSIGL